MTYPNAVAQRYLARCEFKHGTYMQLIRIRRAGALSKFKDCRRELLKEFVDGYAEQNENAATGADTFSGTRGTGDSRQPPHTPVRDSPDQAE